MGTDEEVYWVGGPHIPLFLVRLIVAGVLSVVLVGVPLLLSLLRRWRTVYRLTSRRVSVETGLIARTSSEARIADVRNLRVTNRSIVWGTADIEFETIGGGGVEVAFRSVRNPEGLMRLIRELQDTA